MSVDEKLRILIGDLMVQIIALQAKVEEQQKQIGSMQPKEESQETGGMKGAS